MTAIIIEDEALASRELKVFWKKVGTGNRNRRPSDSVRGSVIMAERKSGRIFSDVHLGDGRSFDIFDK